MQRSVRNTSSSPKSNRQNVPAESFRDRLAMMLALVTVVCLGLGLLLSEGTQFLMPGPLASVHGAIENCSSCHAESGKGKLTWVHRLVAGSPLADSKACVACHKMPTRAFNPHGASDGVLKQSTEQLSKFAADTPAPEWARLQDIAFPIKEVARGLYCATCHQEHQGGNFSLNKIPNDRCQSCHVLKFDSFDGHHPEFRNYPFKRRTRIAYDHVGHFEKHFPEVAKKDPTKRIPATCSACHNSNADRRVMATAPFEQTCSGCHLDQILGKERVSGPKGIAFLTLPGLDLKTLKEKNALIGEWPEASDAELSPFMKMMIGRDERGRALITIVNDLNLQDLSDASDDQIGAVTTLVWEIKRLFYALISRKASEVLAELNIGGGKLSADLVANLTSSIPRDVIISAQQQWLPNLALELGNRRSAGDQNQTGWNTAITAAQPAAPEDKTSSDEDTATPRPEAAVSDPPRKAKLDPPVCTMSILGQCLLFKGGEAAKAKPEEPEGDAANIEAADDDTEGAPLADEQPDAIQSEEAAENATNQTTGGKETLPAKEQLGASQTELAIGQTDSANEGEGANKPPSADLRPAERTADQTDDLLSPTAEERREIEASIKKAAEGGNGDGDAVSDADAATGSVADSIESDVDSETWADHGGWYRQDYAIFYRPTGHKDKFIYSWLALTGTRAPKVDTGSAAAVFDALTNKDAQGSCTKCHSVDDLRNKGRVVNFSPLSVNGKRGRFTNFIHEPHFQAVGIGQRIGIVENRGCLTCHVLENGTPYLKTYEQGDPRNFASNFGAIKKDLCQTCHNSSTARQDCLLCHKYHVNGVNTPIMNTRIPTQ